MKQTYRRQSLSFAPLCHSEVPLSLEGRSEESVSQCPGHNRGGGWRRERSSFILSEESHAPAFPSRTPVPSSGLSLTLALDSRLLTSGMTAFETAGMTAGEHPRAKPPHPGPLPQGERERGRGGAARLSFAPSCHSERSEESASRCQGMTGAAGGDETGRHLF